MSDQLEPLGWLCAQLLPSGDVVDDKPIDKVRIWLDRFWRSKPPDHCVGVLKIDENRNLSVVPPEPIEWPGEEPESLTEQEDQSAP